MVCLMKYFSCLEKDYLLKLWLHAHKSGHVSGFYLLEVTSNKVVSFIHHAFGLFSFFSDSLFISFLFLFSNLFGLNLLLFSFNLGEFFLNFSPFWMSLLDVESNSSSIWLEDLLKLFVSDNVLSREHGKSRLEFGIVLSEWLLLVVVALDRTICVLTVEPEGNKSHNNLSYLPGWVPRLLMEVRD